MPDRTLTMPANGEPQQFTLAASSTGSATAGAIVVVIPDGMTNESLRRALANAAEIARRNPQQMTGL